MPTFETRGALHPEEHRDIIVYRPELDRILTHIEQADHYVALRSPHQTGKTTLLYQIRAHLHGRGYGVVHLDLSGLSDLGTAEFYQTIGVDIWDGLSGLTDCTANAALHPQRITDQNRFCDYLTELSAHTPHVRKLVLMLDEIGSMPEGISTTFFPCLRRFFHSGRRPSKTRYLYQKVMFIFAGALDLRLLIQGPNSPLLNICELFSLEDFSREQERSLASRLEGFRLAEQEVIAEAVRRWCDGHPYLTMRLYALIDASQECRRVSVNQLPEVVDRLVAKHILYDSDANVAHIFNRLQDSKAYREQVFAILTKAKRKSLMHAEDLLSIGIIKRSSDLNLKIRNKIYEEKLNTFFND